MAGHCEGNKNSTHHVEACDLDSFIITIVNGGNTVWKFLLYQANPTESELTPAWFVSPEVPVGEKPPSRGRKNIRSAMWSEMEQMRPGTIFHATGQKECNPEDKNIVNFTFVHDTPQLSDAYGGGEKGALTVMFGDNNPTNRFAIGVGMSGKSIYVANAKSNTKHVFVAKPCMLSDFCY